MWQKSVNAPSCVQISIYIHMRINKYVCSQKKIMKMKEKQYGKINDKKTLQMLHTNTLIFNFRYNLLHASKYILHLVINKTTT